MPDGGVRPTAARPDRDAGLGARDEISAAPYRFVGPELRLAWVHRTVLGSSWVVGRVISVLQDSRESLPCLRPVRNKRQEGVSVLSLSETRDSRESLCPASIRRGTRLRGTIKTRSGRQNDSEFIGLIFQGNGRIAFIWQHDECCRGQRGAAEGCVQLITISDNCFTGDGYRF